MTCKTCGSETKRLQLFTGMVDYCPCEDAKPAIDSGENNCVTLGEELFPIAVPPLDRQPTATMRFCEVFANAGTVAVYQAIPTFAVYQAIPTIEPGVYVWHWCVVPIPEGGKGQT